jgi:predicted protein tyrosine phosphatase
MRKRYRVLLIAAFAAALAGRFGYALSLEPQPIAVHAPVGVAPSTAVTVVAAPVLMHSMAAPSTTAAPVLHNAMPDAGKMLLVGTFLFGLSALVRKAI